MSESVFLLYFDPYEVEPETDDPAYLRGAFSTHDLAAAALKRLASVADDPRWTIVEERLGEIGWTEGFVTVRTSEDDDESSQ